MRDVRSLVAACLLIAVARGADAQAPAPQPAGCTYATCALRVEPGFWGPRLVRGATGEPLSRLSGFGGGVEPLLAAADSAGYYARSYVHNERTASTLAIVAVVTFGIISTQYDRFGRSGDVSPSGAAAMIGGAGVGIASLLFSVRGSRDLSRSIWWYNAALPR